MSGCPKAIYHTLFTKRLVLLKLLVLLSLLHLLVLLLLVLRRLLLEEVEKELCRK